MSDIMNIIREMNGECHCGVYHETSVRDVRIGSGLVHSVGEILRENSFPKALLLVADKDTLKAAEGIIESLEGFDISYHIWDTLRVATMREVEEVESLIKDKDIGVLSVGTGSVNDPCRLAAARQNKMLCIFGTAPSMDGFASYSSPIVKDGFKASYAAKSPEVIIGDTRILAAAPSYLKSSGFGDMVAKYVALIDWQISALLTGETYCDRVAALTRGAIDILMSLADKVTVNDEETAGKIFEALLMTGIGMSYMKNSRPASGCEHIIAHLIECKELPLGIIPNYHGEDVGVCTLEMLKYYGYLASLESVCAHKERIDWDAVYRYYGDMADEVRALNYPITITDLVRPEDVSEKWQEIRAIIKSVPSYEECLIAMKKAGCKTTIEEIGKSSELFSDCVKYSPFMRKRLTLLRMKDMIQ